MRNRGQGIELESKALRRIGLRVLLTISLALAFAIGRVSATETIYIRADGSVDPPTAPIQRNGNVYTFTDHITYPTYNGIVVEKDSITLDGNAYSLEGEEAAIDLSCRSFVTVKNIEIKGLLRDGIHMNSFECGSEEITVSQNHIQATLSAIYLDSCLNCQILENVITDSRFGIFNLRFHNSTIAGNMITADYTGILIRYSENSNILGNTITSYGSFIGDAGISLWYSSNHSIIGNECANRERGVELSLSSNNVISENNLTNNNYGIMVDESSNNVISKNEITSNGSGVELDNSSNYNWIVENIIYANHGYGVRFDHCDWNTISENTITANNRGIRLHYCSHNTVCENILDSNYYGILLVRGFSNRNLIYHNDFINNIHQVLASIHYSINTWDAGYPSGGNYWSNYPGIDRYSGPDQNLAGSDAIGDIPYVINSDNQDRYPLMFPHRAPVPPATAQLGLIVDGSSNISSADFATIKSGIADAIRNNMPHNRTLDLTLIQYGDTMGVVVLPPTVVTSANFEAIASATEEMSQIGYGTPMADGLYSTWMAMKSSPQFENATKRAINIAAVGSPNEVLSAIPSPTGDPRLDVIWVRNTAAVEGLRELDAEAMAVTSQDLWWMRDSLVYPQPGKIAPPYIPGWVDSIESAEHFAEAISQKTHRLLFHDIAVIDVTPSERVVVQGYLLPISVTIKNQGGYTDTFNSIGYANKIVIDTIVDIVLRNESTVCDTFIWNTTGATPGDYTIKAHVPPLEGEKDTHDNTCVNGIVTILPPVICGDANDDANVDMADVVYIINYLFNDGIEPVPIVCVADANGDGEVGIVDVMYLLKVVLKNGPPPADDCCMY
jgi:parallel beta-helix repeat protein